MDDNACFLNKRVALESFASKLAPTMFAMFAMSAMSAMFSKSRTILSTNEITPAAFPTSPTRPTFRRLPFL
jgi:hypothetical protein